MKPRRWLARGVVAMIAVVLVLWLASLLPSLNPFATRTTDRSQPVLLQSVRNLAQFHAAVGDFQVVVDIEHDVPTLPDFIAGERTLFVAAGTVNAYVDLATLPTEALRVDRTARSVEVRLPAAALAEPSLDNDRTYLVTQQRGLWNRTKAVFETPAQQEYYQVAADKISDAAREAGLTERATANTRDTLTGLFASLGFRVTFR
ncbi:MAG: DUF4230 domain-containing protein [Actinophytocola sp.]|uniref:DUF4230 domain-containing protein n=1 Tax=Actinophytocola sp. TaxID=1872138 RepID=UPI003D6C2BBF